MARSPSWGSLCIPPHRFQPLLLSPITVSFLPILFWNIQMLLCYSMMKPSMTYAGALFTYCVPFTATLTAWFLRYISFSCLQNI
ncbi:hypothetical protein CRYUN_Cryun24cG0047600 [Craigia yunnanensis]